MQLRPLTGPGAPAQIAGELHAFLAPSAAFRWVLCPGSALMESLAPDRGDNTASREGAACHWVMLQALTAQDVAEGSMAPDGVMVTRTMLEAVDLLREDIARRLGPNWRNMITVERPVSVARVHAKCWGTPDVRAWALLPSGRRKLFVWDLKYGFGPVEAFESEQLVSYAAGCLTEANETAATFKQSAFGEDRIDCELIVVQPRAYHAEGPARTWAIPATGLRDYVFRLSMAADEATGPTPVCKPTPVACENCKARASCATLQKAAYRCMDIAEQATPRDLSDDAAGLELALLDDAEALLKARKSGLEEVVKHRLQQGARVAHWFYGPGRGSTKWTRPESEVITLGQMLGVPLDKPAEAVTPLQAIAKGVPESLIKQYSQTVPGAVKLTRSDGSETRKIFNNAP